MPLLRQIRGFKRFHTSGEFFISYFYFNIQLLCSNYYNLISVRYTVRNMKKL